MRSGTSVAVVALLLGAVPIRVAAEPPPVPAATVPAVRNDAPIGCCCIKDSASSQPAGCGYGLSEDKCKTAGATLPTWTATWTAGKCPAER